MPAIENLLETLFIKITNSPRMGICGYTGENDVYELE